MIASETAIAMASARVETFSFLFAFSKCSCAAHAPGFPRRSVIGSYFASFPASMASICNAM